MIYWPNQKPALNKLWAAQRCQNIKYKRIKKWKSWVNVLFEEAVNYERGKTFFRMMEEKNGLMEYFSIILKKRFITGSFRSLQAHLSEWCTAH